MFMFSSHTIIASCLSTSPPPNLENVLGHHWLIATPRYPAQKIRRLSLKQNLLIDLKCRATGRWGGKQRKNAIYRFTPHMSDRKSQVWQGQSQEPGTPCASPIRCQRFKFLDHYPLTSQAHKQEAPSEREQLGLNLACPCRMLALVHPSTDPSGYLLYNKSL